MSAIIKYRAYIVYDLITRVFNNSNLSGNANNFLLKFHIHVVKRKNMKMGKIISFRGFIGPSDT